MPWERRITKDFTAAPQPRNVVILMDGTWNDDNGRQNNGAVRHFY